jgi:hypothetical protein
MAPTVTAAMTAAVAFGSLRAFAEKLAQNDGTYRGAGCGAQKSLWSS